MDPRGRPRRSWPPNPLELVEGVARDVVLELVTAGFSNTGTHRDESAPTLEIALDRAQLLIDMNNTPEIRSVRPGTNPRRPTRYPRGRNWVPRVRGSRVDRMVDEGYLSIGQRSRLFAQAKREIAKLEKARDARDSGVNGISQAGEHSQAGHTRQETRLVQLRSSDLITGVKSHNEEKQPRTASKSLPSSSKNPPTYTHPSVLSAKRLHSSGKSLSTVTSNLHPSRVPLSLTPGHPAVVFLSQILPSSFSELKRFQVRQIFLFDAPYIPACIVQAPGHSPRSFFGNLWDNTGLLSTGTFQKHKPPAKQHHHRPAMRLGAACQEWPQGRLPTEIYQRITEYLPRDSIEKMRLVCKEFEVNVSTVLFQSVVLPFRSEIYGMINASRRPSIKDVKGKGKAKEMDEADLAIGDAPFGIYDQKLAVGSVHKGMAVFKGWGPRIRKFAMVFEVDGVSLQNPPVKVSQETHASFWGSYQWPHTQYNRYLLCAGLEETADETDYMTEAFSNLSEVIELGLSLDSGLGWLAGSDVSDRAKVFNAKAKIFGPRHALPDEAARKRTEEWQKKSDRANVPFVQHLVIRYDAISKRLSVPPASFYEMFRENLILRIINDMLRMSTTELAWHIRSGFGPSLKRVGITETQFPILWSAASRVPVHENQPEPFWITPAQVVYQALGAIESCRQTAVDGPEIQDEYLVEEAATEDNKDPEDEEAATLDEDPDMAYHDSSSEEEESDVEEEVITLDDDEWQNFQEFAPISMAPPLIFNNLDFNTAPNVNPNYARDCSGGSNRFLLEALIPNNLTTAQKEWLLETEWAQRAFLASYTLAIMDNLPTFQNVRTFTVTKLSSHYLPQLQRPEFWAALPNLSTVTIIVSPDWRDVIKEHAGYVSDPAINPSEASGALYRLVQGCMGPLQNIKTLTLGFVGGGERAPGIFARNKHVVPGPITENPKDQLDTMSLVKTLHLPYVEHLTFTNCWFGPHALRTFVTGMRQASLHTLRLDSVSLIAPRGDPVALAVVHANAVQAVAAHMGALPPTAPGPVAGPATANVIITWLTINPRCGSWPDVVDTLTPAATIATQRALYNPHLQAPVARPTGALQRLEFVSCGYVRLTARPELQADLGTAPTRQRNPHLVHRGLELEKVMMASADKLLGHIHPVLKPEEVECLEGAFGMQVGWGDVPERFDPLEDDEAVGGTGRFSGVLVAE